MLGPLVTASVQVGADVRPLGGRWPVVTAAPMAVAAPERAPEAVPDRAPEPAPELKSGPTYGTVHGRRPNAAPEGSPELKFRPDLRRTEGGTSVPPLGLASRGRRGRCRGRAWLAIGAAGLARFGTRFVRLHRSLRSGPPVSAPHLRQMVEALRQAAGTRAPIRLTTSSTCAVPLALAGRQVVLPERFLDQLDAEQQQAALAHEVAHVVRRDPALARPCRRARARVLLPAPQPHRAGQAGRVGGVSVRPVGRAAHPRPLALARCLSAVAAWTSPESDEMLAGASPMAHSDSPLVRRVTESWQTARVAHGSVGGVAGRWP